MEKFALVILLITFYTAGQNTSFVITYKEVLNLGDPVERYWFLYFDDHQLICFETNGFDTDSLKTDIRKRDLNYI